MRLPPSIAIPLLPAPEPLPHVQLIGEFTLLDPLVYLWGRRIQLFIVFEDS